MNRYKLTIEFEAPDERQAIQLTENALDQVPGLDHTLEVKPEGEESWDLVEAI